MIAISRHAVRATAFHALGPKYLYVVAGYFQSPERLRRWVNRTLK